jgi:hypothetical protein
VDTVPPTTPGSLVLVPGEDSIQAYWDPSTDNDKVESYDVYLDGSLYESVSAPDTSYNISGLSPGSSYKISVKSVDPSGNTSGMITKDTTTLKSSTSIFENKNGSNVQLYPNPVSNSLEIQSDDQMHRIEIIDKAGRLLVTKMVNNKMSRIETRGLHAGVYIVKIHTARNMVSRKIIKIK